MLLGATLYAYEKAALPVSCCERHFAMRCDSTLGRFLPNDGARRLISPLGQSP